MVNLTEKKDPYQGKKQKENREMSLSEPKVKTIWVCPQCGWVKPTKLSCHSCGKCNATLVPKIVKVEDCELDPAHYIKSFTEEYKNRNWHQCRYGKDLRTCLEYHSKNVNGKFVIFCKDDEPCDAKWTGHINKQNQKT